MDGMSAVVAGFASSNRVCLKRKKRGLRFRASTSGHDARTIVRFDPRGPDRQDVIVFNPDTETMYVEVEVLDVINPF